MTSPSSANLTLPYEIDLEERIKRVEYMQEQAKKLKKQKKEEEEEKEKEEVVPLIDDDLAAFGLPTGFSSKK